MPRQKSEPTASSVTMPSGWRFMSPIERADLADFSYRPDADPFAIDIQSPVDRAGVNTIHHVVYDPVNKYVSCDCPAGQFRRNCWASEAYKVIFLPAILAALGEESVILIDGEIIEAKPLEREVEPNDKQAQIDAALAEYDQRERTWRYLYYYFSDATREAQEITRNMNHARKISHPFLIAECERNQERVHREVLNIRIGLAAAREARDAARARYESLLPVAREPDVMRKDDFD